MRKAQKQSILELLKTLFQAHIVIKNYIEHNDFENALSVLNDCQSSAIQLGEVLEKSEGEGFITVGFLEEYCEEIFRVASHMTNEINGKKALKLLDKKLIKVENSIKNDIKAKLEIVFMPYKTSMWDSLESIWREANNDPNCDVYVVPISYYDRNPDHSFGVMHYEGNDMPDYVKVTHYDNYDLNIRKPDVIYIHNPYDEYNYVTTVDPRFYSYELKKHTEMLVYVPYFIAGVYNNFKIAAGKAGASAIKHADMVIAQNETHRDLFIKCGCPSHKVTALGSPKLDSVFYMNEHPPIMPKGWMEKLVDKKVFLLNFSLGTILNDEKWLIRYMYFLNKMSEINDIAVIWRPHPLMEATLKSMRPHLYNKYIDLLNTMKSKDNIILDFNENADTAFYYSDALISDYSSLIFKYIATAKPVYAFLINPKGYSKETGFAQNIILFDFYYSYFFEFDEGLWEYESRTDDFNLHFEFCTSGVLGVKNILLFDYINMVLDGNDPLKALRIDALYKSMKNADGTCGKKTHEYIKKEVLSK